MKAIIGCILLMLSFACLGGQSEPGTVNDTIPSTTCMNPSQPFFQQSNGMVYMVVKSDCSMDSAYMMSMDDVTEQLMEGLKSVLGQVCSFEYLPQSVDVSVGLVSVTWDVNKAVCDKFKSKENI